VTGERPVMRVTPSHLLTREQAAQVRSVAPKSGGLRFDTTDKLQALAQLARILGLVQPEAAASSSTTINATQVNVSAPGETNAFELARRLAFALEKAARATPPALEGPMVEGDLPHVAEGPGAMCPARTQRIDPKGTPRPSAQIGVDDPLVRVADRDVGL